MPLTDLQLNAALQLVNPQQAGSEAPADLQDALVLRGYLEPARFADANGNAVWRLNLSARKDVWLEFIGNDAIRVAPYRPTNPPDGLRGGVTLWLPSVPPRRYFISRPLQTPTGFVSGELLEDFMGLPETRAPVWPEQQYGSPGWPFRSNYPVRC